MREVLTLTHAWQKILNGESLAQAVKASVLRELTDLACVAVGGLLSASDNPVDWLVWTERGEQSGWAMAIVFDWMADQAEVLGDLPAAAINRENARVARIAA